VNPCPPPAEMPPLLTEAQCQAVLEAALTTVAQVGIRLPEEDLRRRVLAQAGQGAGERVRFSRAETEGYLARWRARHGGEAAAGPRRGLGLSVMPYAHTYLDPVLARLRPLTEQALKSATQFLGTLHAEGVQATVPGYPVDVPAPLQPLAQYKLGAQYNPAGGGYGWLGEPATARYVLAMAQVMGQPVRATVVYVTSPLRLGGAELHTAVALRDEFDWLAVGNMGSCGATLPLRPQAALALAWAEALGAAQCLEALAGLPVEWGGSIEPFDMRAGTIPFGAPEQVAYYRMAREAGAWLLGRKPSGFGHPLLTMAKRPGAQAMLEKAAAAATAVAWGADSLGAAGSLSADEVFSPTQTLLDRELRDWLAGCGVGPFALAREAGELVAEILQDATGHGYMDAETTLASYREATWHPRYLRREMLGAWQARGRPGAVDAARNEAAARIEGATWVLDDARFAALEGLYEEARRELSPGA
jgi:trimethylamine:corrinoid methyltransferase-like protein